MSTGMKSTSTRKLRVLCFHGYLQNAQVIAVLKCAVPHDHLASTAVQPASDQYMFACNRSFRGK